MARNSKYPEYTADQWRALKQRLEQHTVTLKKTLKHHVEAFDDTDAFNCAIQIRDTAQYLSTTYLRLNDIDMFIESAKRDGTKAMMFSLSECGLPND